MESRNRTRPHRRAAAHCRTRPRRLRTVAAALLACVTLVGCGEAPPTAGATIPSDSFVEAMVALRTSPVMGTSGFLPAGEPERILGERGLTPEDLRRFVEVHGANVPMMTDLWTQIESRVAEARGVTEPGN